ncbi:hypothetical protein LCAUW1_2445 [Lacticaseibacillus paracasei]|nr:hypothetical protein LCAUW1_2445 [Lacticaseibacillus paracasei]
MNVKKNAIMVLADKHSCAVAIGVKLSLIYFKNEDPHLKN